MKFNHEGKIHDITGEKEPQLIIKWKFGVYFSPWLRKYVWKLLFTSRDNLH